LVSLKHLAGLDPKERRAKQKGAFRFKSELGKAEVQVRSQGVKTGENIVSAPPKHGLSSTWQGLLVSADRLTRDCIGLVSSDEMETAIENIIPKEYESDDLAATALKAALLTQPDAIALPEIPSSDVIDIRDNFRTAAKYVSCQRLLRRLCPDCKEEVQVPPKTIQKLGGDPRAQKTIYRQWRLPPPEQRVDEKGKPIEFPTCETCRGLGYIGRIGIFEMITVNDSVREALKKTPKIAAIDKVATESKAKKSMKQGAYQLVLLGVTSLAEVQSTLKK